MKRLPRHSVLLIRKGQTVRQVYVSTVARPRTVDLPDGSRMTLDAASRVAVAFDDVRGLTLTDGAARFAVHHDRNRPFSVQVDNATMTALGTVFSAERLTGGSELRVFRGRVRLDMPQHVAVVIEAGRYARVEADCALLPIAIPVAHYI